MLLCIFVAVKRLSMRVFLFLSLSILLLLSGCTSSKPNRELVSEFKGVLPWVMDNDEGLLHGIELGMTTDEVRKHALPNDSLSDPSVDFLFFEAHLDSLHSYTYECSFDEKGLNTITLMIYLVNENSAASSFADFKTFFTKKYGTPNDIGVGYTWEVTTGKRPAKIELIERTDYLYGVLQINFFDRSFEARPQAGDSLVLR